jgi:hypothetical protein
MVLAEALAEMPEAARLGKQIRGKDPNATRHARIRLGLIINIADTTWMWHPRRTVRC